MPDNNFIPWDDIVASPKFQGLEPAQKRKVMNVWVKENLNTSEKFNALDAGRQTHIIKSLEHQAGLSVAGYTPQKQTQVTGLTIGDIGRASEDVAMGKPVVAGERNREAIKTVEEQPEATWGEIFKSIPESAVNQTAQGIGGIAQAIGEGLKLPKVAQWGRDVYQGTEQIQQELTPNIKSGLKGNVYGAGVSVLQNLMTLPLSVITGNPAPSLAIMGMTAGGQGYGEARKRGLDVGKSLAYGTSMGGSEVVTEWSPMSTLLKPGISLGKRLFTEALQEVFGENVNTVHQHITKQLAFNPNATVGDFLNSLPQQIKDTTYQTLLSSPLLAGASHLVVGGETKPKPLYDTPKDFTGEPIQEEGEATNKGLQLRKPEVDLPPGYTPSVPTTEEKPFTPEEDIKAEGETPNKGLDITPQRLLEAPKLEDTTQETSEQPQEQNDLEKPPGFLPLEKAWGSTREEELAEWDKAVGYIEGVGKQLQPQIDELQDRLKAIKGKSPVKQKLQQQIKFLKDKITAARNEYDEAAAERSLVIAEQAKQRLAEQGFADEETIQHIVDDFLVSSGFEAPYYEMNHNKTLEQLLEEAVQRKLQSDLIKEEEGGIQDGEGVQGGDEGGEGVGVSQDVQRGEEVTNEEIDAKLLPNKAGTFKPSKPTLPAGLRIEKEKVLADVPERLGKLPGMFFAMIEKRLTEVLDVKNNSTGWKSFEDDNGVHLVNPTTKEMVSFGISDKVSGSELVRRRAEARAYAIDNPITQSIPEGEIITQPLIRQEEPTKDIVPSPKETVHAQEGTSHVGKEPSSGGVAPVISKKPTKIPTIKDGRSAKKALKIVDDLLLSRAIEKAKTVADEWNLERYSRMDPKNITPAERNDLNVYLFGDTKGRPVEVLLEEKTTQKETPNIGTIDNIDTVALSKVLKVEVDKGVKLNKLAVKKIVADVLGVKVGDLSPSNPQYQHKAIEEAFEYAIVQKGREIITSDLTEEQKYEAIKKVYENQPILGERTSETIKNQAYSTPLPIAYLLNNYLRIDKNTSVLGLTAGNGMLLIGTNPKRTLANELDTKYRSRHLKDTGFDVIETDALSFMGGGEYYKNIFDVAVENPPFGKAQEKRTYDGFPVSKLEHQIAIENLKGMKDNGRAAFIIGGHNFKDGKMTETDRIFLNYLYSHYNVTHNIDVDGDVYSRMGTKFPIRILTINGRKATPDKTFAPTEQSKVESAKTFDDIRQILSKESEVTNAQTNKPEGSSGEVGQGEDRATQEGTEGRQPVAVPRTPGGHAGAENISPRQPGGHSVEDSREAGRTGGEVQHGGKVERPGIPSEGLRPVGASGGVSSKQPRLTSEEQTTPDTNEHQSPYTVTSKGRSGNNVAPKNLAKAVKESLKRIASEIGEDVDEYVRQKLQYKDKDELFGALSGEQIDAVALAVYNIDNGQGLIVGDQTGVGKGRIAASIIKYANTLGLKPIFITAKPNLFSDIYRDLVDIGHPIKPFILHGDSATKIVDADDNVLFKSQYANKQEKSNMDANPESAMQQYDALFTVYTQFSKDNAQRKVIQRLAPGNVVIMDESHEASGDSKRGEFMRGVIENAKGVLYSSATYAKRPDTMPLYFRTALGKAGMSIEELIDAMNRGGVALQQVVAKLLSEGGQYIRRELNFKGITFDTKIDTAKKEIHTKQADGVTSILRKIVDFDRNKSALIDDLNDIAEEDGKKTTGQESTFAGVTSANFSSTVHNLVNQLLLALKADTTVAMAIQSIKDGKKPVITLMNTMESFLQDIVESEGLKVGDEIGFTFREILNKALRGTLRYTETSPTGEKTKKTLTKADLTPELLEEYEAIEHAISELQTDLPASPIDYIRHKVQQAGYTIDEITGRGYFVDYSTPTPTIGRRTQKQIKDRNSVINRFNGGKWEGNHVGGTNALILNAAGSTGLSIHSSVRFGDRKQREMIIVQPDLNIDVVLQTLGRVFRKGMALDEGGNELKPLYKLLQSDLPAEKRPAVVLRKKMSSLNANTTADADSAVTLKNIPDMMNMYGDEVVLDHLKNNPDLNALLGDPLSIDGDESTQKEDAFRKVTGRIALLPVKTQEQFFDEIETAYNDLIDQLNERGENNLVAKDYDFRAKTESRKVIFQGTDESQPFTSSAYLEKVSVAILKRPHNRAKIVELVNSKLQGENKQKAAEKFNADIINEIKQESNEYLLNTIERNPALFLLGNPTERLEQLKLAYGLITDRIAAMLDKFKIGNTYQLDSGFAPYFGVLIDIKRTKSGNPAAMSKVKLVFATSTSTQTKTLPLSRSEELAGARIEDYGIVEDWDSRWIQSGRETRHIITGNILTGFDRLKHKAEVINYTTENGDRKTGILVPRSVDVETEFSGKSVHGDDAYRYITNPSRLGSVHARITSTDGDVTVSKTGGLYSLLVPKSKVAGSKYFLNQQLIETTNGGFRSFSNSNMIAHVDKDRLKAMFEELDKMGVRFVVASQEEQTEGTDDDGGGGLSGDADLGGYAQEHPDHMAAIKQSLITGNIDMGVPVSALRVAGKLLGIAIKQGTNKDLAWDKLIKSLANERGYAMLRGDKPKTIEEQLAPLTPNYSGGDADIGGYADDVEDEDAFRPIEGPELIELYKAINDGKYPIVMRKLRAMAGRAVGYAKYVGDKADILLSANIFTDAKNAVKVLAHEIGHIIDWLPDKTHSRGNIFGHLLSLKKYLKHTIDSLPGIKKQHIMRELKALSFKWKPLSKVDKARAGINKSYMDYRMRPSELYADATSVLFNNPKMFKKYAPKAFELFLKGLDSKPLVKQAYEAIQKRIKEGPESVALGRQKQTLLGFAGAESDLAQPIKEMESVTFAEKWRKFIDGFKKELVDRHSPLYSSIADDMVRQDVRNAVEEFLYYSAEGEAYFKEVENKIITPFLQSGITEQQVGEYMQMQRIIHERQKIANPNMHNVKTAEDALGTLKKQMGDELYNKMEEFVERFWQIRKAYIVSRLKQSGMYTDELIEKIEANEKYATFAVRDYITPEIEKGYSSGITGRIFKQVGTVKEIMNPFTATIMKDLTLIRSVVRNNAVRSSIKALLNHREDFVDFKPADTELRRMPGGKVVRVPKELPDGSELKLLTYMEKGKVVGYYVPSDIADAFEVNPIEADTITKFLSALNKPFKELLTRKNPGFWLFNLTKDMFSSVKLLPKASLHEFIPLMIGSIGDAWHGVVGYDELTQDLLRGKALIATINRDAKSEDTQLQRLRRRYGYTDTSSGLRHKIRKFLDYLNIGGELSERITKIAAYKYLNKHFPDMSHSDKMHLIRWVGSPAFLVKGEHTPWVNNILLFFNPMVQGTRIHLETAKKRPLDYWWKTTKYNILPKVVMMTASYGLIDAVLRNVFRMRDDDDWIKKMFDRVSSYDLTNYITIPFGWSQNKFVKKLMYLRIPQDEFGRVVGGVVNKVGDIAYNAITNKDKPANIMELVSLLDYGIGQFPSVSPPLSAISSTIQFLATGNTYDTFTGRFAIPKGVADAKDDRALKYFAEYLANKLGVGIVHRFDVHDIGQEKTFVEKVFESPISSNILGRWIKVGESGIYEKLNEPVEAIRIDKAREMLNVREAMLNIVNQVPYEKWDARQKESFLRYQFTHTQKELFGKLNEYMTKKSANALAIALTNAHTKEEKIKVIQKADELGLFE